MFSSRVCFTRKTKKGISFSLASYNCVHSRLYAPLYVGLSVWAANLMQYCIESFCLLKSRGNAFALVNSDSTGGALNAHRASRNSWCAIGSWDFGIDMSFWLCNHSQVMIVSMINRGGGESCDPHLTWSLNRTFSKLGALKYLPSRFFMCKKKISSQRTRQEVLLDLLLECRYLLSIVLYLGRVFLIFVNYTHIVLVVENSKPFSLHHASKFQRHDCKFTSTEIRFFINVKIKKSSTCRNRSTLCSKYLVILVNFKLNSIRDFTFLVGRSSSELGYTRLGF